MLLVIYFVAGKENGVCPVARLMRRASSVRFCYIPPTVFTHFVRMGPDNNFLGVDKGGLNHGLWKNWVGGYLPNAFTVPENKEDMATIVLSSSKGENQMKGDCEC